ncbi:hypothetical protein HBH98_130390 [Parastagonospora nodorum]|nr:hypothetical protein HBH48_150130 [Parastagonospora nodorum]KAH4102743.1 hypothetical protein HBH46_118690 [Parastagonospora nodorum]KAH4127053.1 hypothetical protein HBH47_047320 [Parastagonospora nodorum]KAH4251146.1 hypothetical protein HBI03_229710 [Parastagonospora nodorum]KAH4275924.1 hypothetical protein HBI04_115590 [Parastagonospora nodorum]
MSSTKPKSNRHPSAYNAELRLSNFGVFSIVALRDYTILIIFVGTFWFWIQAIPATVPIPFPMRWACIVAFWLETISKNAFFFKIITALAAQCISKIEDENHSRDCDLATRTTNLEDWILANFCVIAGLSSIGLTAQYWRRVLSLMVQFLMNIITLGIWMSFCWTLIIGGLLSLFWFIKWTIRRYRKAKGIEQDEAWRFLIAGSAIRMYNISQGPKADRVLEQVLEVSDFMFQGLTALPKFWLDIIGFHIGRGPFFNRLPDGWKAERKNCKTPEDIQRFFAVLLSCFGKTLDQEEDNEKEPQDHEEAYFHPSVFEQEPNPVIFAHLRGEPLSSPDSGRAEAKNTSECHLMDTAEIDGGVFPEVDVHIDDTIGPKNVQKTPFVPSHNCPTTISVNLSSFQCTECLYVARKKNKLNKHIKQKHERPYGCAHYGCKQTFGLRTHLERHQTTHTEKKEFECSNVFCKTQFTREDNLKRHIKGCIAST